MSYSLVDEDKGEDNLVVAIPSISPDDAKKRAQLWIQSGFGVPKGAADAGMTKATIIFYPFVSFTIFIDVDYEVDVGRFNNSHFERDFAEWQRERKRNDYMSTYSAPNKKDYYTWTHAGGHLSTQGHFNVVPMFYPGDDETWGQYGGAMLELVQSLSPSAMAGRKDKVRGVEPIIIKPFGVGELTNAYSAQISNIVTDQLRSQVKADKTENWSTNARYDLDVRTYYMIPFYRIDYSYRGSAYFAVVDCFGQGLAKGRRPRSGIAKLLSIFGR